MTFFILGALAGGAAVWLWARRRAGGGTFAGHLARELEARGRLEQLEHLEARVKCLERELDLARAAKGAPLRPSSFSPAPGGPAGPPRGKAAGNGPRPAASAGAEKALALLEKGCTREEILRQTRLGGGALDLIFTLHQKNCGGVNPDARTVYGRNRHAGAGGPLGNGEQQPGEPAYRRV